MKKRNIKRLLKIRNNKSVTNMRINGIELGRAVTSFELKQEAGEFPQLTLNMTLIDGADIVLRHLEEANVKINKIEASDSNE